MEAEDSFLWSWKECLLPDWWRVVLWVSCHWHPLLNRELGAPLPCCSFWASFGNPGTLPSWIYKEKMCKTAVASAIRKQLGSWCFGGGTNEGERVAHNCPETCQKDGWLMTCSAVKSNKRTELSIRRETLQSRVMILLSQKWGSRSRRNSGRKASVFEGFFGCLLWVKKVGGIMATETYKYNFF